MGKLYLIQPKNMLIEQDDLQSDGTSVLPVNLLEHPAPKPPPNRWLKSLIILGIELLLTLPLGFGLANLRIGGTAWILSGVVSGIGGVDCSTWIANPILRFARWDRCLWE
jgi:hypothetical protein